jgi:transmembrane sensor
MTAPRPDLAQTPEKIAAEWFGLRRSGAMGAEEARAFEVWLAADPEHRAAYDNLEHYWQIAAATRDDPEVLAMRDAAART